MSKSFLLALQARFSQLQRTRFISFIITQLTLLSSLIKHGCMCVPAQPHTREHAAGYSSVSLFIISERHRKEQRTSKQQLPPSWIWFQGGLTLSCGKPSKTERLRVMKGPYVSGKHLHGMNVIWDAPVKNESLGQATPQPVDGVRHPARDEPPLFLMTLSCAN